MKSFSEISNSANITRRDKVINDFVAESGMQRGIVTRMFESQIAFGMSVDEIEQSFKKLLTPDISDPVMRLETSEIKDMKTFNDKMITITREFQESHPLDGVGLLNIAANILLVENEDKFKPLFDKIEIACEIPEIMKLKEVTVQRLDEDGKQPENRLEEIRLFESLREILSKNVSKFGYTYHLENCYQAIWDYLDNEIKNITRENNILSKSQSFNGELIDQILGATVNPMYKNIDTLRLSTPDFQSLVFDLMTLVWNWSEHQDKRVFSMIRKAVYKEYITATTNLATALWSSRTKSTLLNPPSNTELIDNKHYHDHETGAINQILQSISDLRHDKELMFQKWNIEIKNIADCVDIIRALSVDFDVKLRPYLREFCTKTWNLIGRAEHLIYELQRIGQYHVR